MRPNLINDTNNIDFCTILQYNSVSDCGLDNDTIQFTYATQPIKALTVF